MFAADATWDGYRARLAAWQAPAAVATPTALVIAPAVPVIAVLALAPAVAASVPTPIVLAAIDGKVNGLVTMARHKRGEV